MDCKKTDLISLWLLPNKMQDIRYHSYSNLSANTSLNVNILSIFPFPLLTLTPLYWHFCTSLVPISNVWNVPEMRTLPLSVLYWSLCQGMRKLEVVWTSGSTPDLARSPVACFCLLVPVHGLPTQLLCSLIRWETDFGGSGCILPWKKTDLK